MGEAVIMRKPSGAVREGRGIETMKQTAIFWDLILWYVRNERGNVVCAYKTLVDAKKDFPSAIVADDDASRARVAMEAKKLVFSGRVKPAVRGSDGHLMYALWARVYDDASVTVSTGPVDEEFSAMDTERLEALIAAVKTMAPLEDQE